MEILYFSFITIVEQSLRNASPGGRSHFGSANRPRGFSCPLCPWWNINCDKLIRLRKALLKFKHTGSHDDFEEYLNRIKITWRELRHIKHESFNKFCTNLRKDTNNTNPNYV